MPEPLLFVCDSSPVRRGSKLARANLATFETPRGRVFMAFGSQELAAMILALFRAADGVFLVPETRLVPELVPVKSTSPVLVFHTYDDYRAATDHAPDFPWAERIIEFDFAAAAAKLVSLETTSGAVQRGRKDDGARTKLSDRGAGAA